MRRHSDLSAVFQLLRTVPEDNARELLDRIRAGADANEILQPLQGDRGALGGGNERGGRGSAAEEGRRQA